MNNPPGLSQAAVQLQTEFMSHPALLQQYYTAYNAGNLPQPRLDAFKQLLAAASRQQGAPGGAGGPSTSAAPNLGPSGPPAPPQLTAVSSAGQVPQIGSPQPQGSYPLGTSGQRDVAELQELKNKSNAFGAFLQRADVVGDKRTQAENELNKVRLQMKTVQQRLVASMQSNPSLPPHLAQAAAAASGSNDMQAQQRAAMALRQQQIVAQQQRQQQTGSPSLNAAQQQAANLARARSPANVPSGSPPNNDNPQAKRTRVDGPGGAASATPPQPAPPQPGSAPARPASVAQQSSNFNPVGSTSSISENIADRVASNGKPEAFPPARPTLTQGLAAQPVVSTPAVTHRPATGGVGGGAGGQASASAGTAAPPSAADLSRVVPRTAIRDILQSICPGATMDDEVEDFCLDLADEFIETVTRQSCGLAVHRKSDRLEVKDVQLHLDRAWDIQVPGFAADEVRQSQGRRLNPPASQVARAAAVREAARRRGGA